MGHLYFAGNETSVLWSGSLPSTEYTYLSRVKGIPEIRPHFVPEICNDESADFYWLNCMMQHLPLPNVQAAFNKRRVSGCAFFQRAARH
jgi:hypothetical protein